jgi:hypothetical protein
MLYFQELGAIDLYGLKLDLEKFLGCGQSLASASEAATGHALHKSRQSTYDAD